MTSYFTYDIKLYPPGEDIKPFRGCAEWDLEGGTLMFLDAEGYTRWVRGVPYHIVKVLETGS